ncbi:hypothetical protein FPHYL_1458 [Fusarium phyllophilum]|uniref:Uncharacterized protein n=1 Tax=Fusarium phyllophilum TaxID=47803 RepID=A0A8H5KBP0_9HYPO|nr:hypothetical protein FPHYL_1458 [Fusarium phyllophilum]
MTDFLWRPPRKEPGIKRRPLDKRDPANIQYYHNWGFTVYRTYYGQSSDSDKHWETLIDAMTRQSHLALGFYEAERIFQEDQHQIWGLYGDKSVYVDDISRLKKLFRLTLREDPSLLDGLDIAQIRELCRKELPEARKNIEGAKSCFVFVADEEVLKDIARGVFVIKVVGYDWDEDRLGQCWMRIPTGEVLELWQALLLWDSIDSDPYREIKDHWFGEESKRYTWPGDASIHPTGGCSEARTAWPESRSRFSQFRLDY